MSTAADLGALWPDLLGEERLSYRVRIHGNDPMTLLVTSVTVIPAESALDEERVEIRGYELAGPLAHKTGETTAEGGVTDQVRVRLLGARSRIEILDLDEPNEPGRSDVNYSPPVVVPEPSEPALGIELPPEPVDDDVPDEPIPVLSVPDDEVDTTWLAAIRTPPQTLTSGATAGPVVVSAPPGVVERISVSPVRQPLLATSTPIDEWANSSQLRVPRPVLDRIREVARQRMIGRQLLIAAAIERGLDVIEAEGM